jgi:DNA modification methylase
MCREQRNCLTYNNGSKLKTAFSLPEKVIRSNTNDFNELKEKCEERGIPFTHTAGFPVELPELLIKLSTEPGDLVVDLFSGTGTTGQAALSLKRRYVGYELNPAYHEIAQIRLEDYTEQYVFTFFNEDEEEMGEFLLVA